MELNW